MTSNESVKHPEKDTPTKRILKIGGVLLGLTLGAEFLKGLFQHN